jgi:hypothetical protein
MMRIARLTTLLGILAAVVAGSLAGASTAAMTAPTGLHGFLLTANEASTTTFHRSPSFAWKPVAGALHYEFQLSTSTTFHENGVLYDDSSLLGPVASPTITLPWITGSPHSLYARVRALFAGGHDSAWSNTYGFDVVPPSAPTPMSSVPGLLRWTPVAGADRYEVWIWHGQADNTIMNKFEQVNTNVLDEREYYAFHNSQQWIGTVGWRVRAIRLDVLGRKNGLPVAQYGPWSPVYYSTNPTPTDGPIVLNETISDTVSNGSPSSPAHALAPAFSWSGDETLYGMPAPFFRVYVFTDKACINRVFTGAVVASPAYAPRLQGPLAMPPGDDASVADAAGKFLLEGAEGGVLTADFEPADPTEAAAAATPTTSLGGGAASQQDPGFIGAPVDLWDVDWPSSGYYWTVIPVGWNSAAGKWQDLELAQDACAAGQVARFGVSSVPSLTQNHTPFASGLSSNGKLVSATATNKFYGEPLVAWQPAPDATAYEVQWAKKSYPFRTRGKQLTYNTSYVLPLKPGTWYYRVRGYDYNLPTGAQEMAWSQPVKIVVAPPRFHLVAAKRR